MYIDVQCKSLEWCNIDGVIKRGGHKSCPAGFCLLILVRGKGKIRHIMCQNHPKSTSQTPNMHIVCHHHGAGPLIVHISAECLPIL